MACREVGTMAQGLLRCCLMIAAEPETLVTYAYIGGVSQEPGVVLVAVARAVLGAIAGYAVSKISLKGHLWFVRRKRCFLCRG